ncbi:bacteriophage tail fiber protein [Yersinia frederiksenii]|nr:bacteriophage tail fiber protein [Yersinia frederiksenii]
MQKIGDIPNTRADSNGEFTDGNVAAGVPPTILPAEWFNTLQRELIKVVQDGGLALDPNDDTQVLAALKKLFLQSGNNLSEIKAAGPTAVAAALVNLGLGDVTNGRLIKTTIITDTQIFHTQEKTKFVRVRQVAGGGASGAASATGSSQNAVTCPGSVGVYAEALFFSNFDGVLVTIGEGGQPRLGNGFNGGDTSFGNLLICPGGLGSLVGNALTPPSYSSPQSTTSAPTINPAGLLLCSEYGQPVDPAILIALGVATNYHSTVRSKLGNAGIGGMGQLRANNAVQIQGVAGFKGVSIVEEYS